MAIKIKCTCGAMYDDSYKFCPECATPNPRVANRKRLTEVSSEESTEKKPSVRKKFTKIGESDFTNSSSISNIPVNGNSKAFNGSNEINEELDEVDKDYEDDLIEEIEDEDEYEDDSLIDEYEDYEDEEDDEELVDEADYEDEEEIIPSYSKSSTLKAPFTKSTKEAISSIDKKPNSKKISSTTRSSLAKSTKSSYDPNFDGYYDDRLPAILDEVTKTSHMDVILKISLAIVCIAALITYCIFYVQI